MAPSSITMTDLAVLRALNQDYIRAVATSDVERFREILAVDFVCTLADGSFVDRAAFLAQAAQPFKLSDLEAHDIDIRLMGRDFAIVHARTTFTTPEGRAGSGRYTDVWARRDGRWFAVAAHVTRR